MTNPPTHGDRADGAFRTLMRGLVATGVALALINAAIVYLHAGA